LQGTISMLIYCLDRKSIFNTTGCPMPWKFTP